MTPGESTEALEARRDRLWAAVCPILHAPVGGGVAPAGDLSAADLRDLFHRLGPALEDLELYPESAYFHDTLLGRTPGGQRVLARLEVDALAQVERDRADLLQELPYGMVRGWFPVQVQGRLVHCLVSGRLRRPGVRRKELEALAHEAGLPPDELEDVFARIPSQTEKQIERTFGLLRALRDTVQTALEERARAQRLSAQLGQAEKTGSLGTLSAGLAHHFNNLLSVILGYSSLLLNHEDLSEKAAQALRKIAESAQRGRRATEELLAFSEVAEEREIACRIHDHLRSVLAMLAPRQGGAVPLTLRLEAARDRMLARPSAVHRLVLAVLTYGLEAAAEDGAMVLASGLVESEGEEALRLTLSGEGPLPGPGGEAFDELVGLAGALGGSAVLAAPDGEPARVEISLPLAAATAEPRATQEVAALGPRQVQASTVWVVDDNPNVCEFCAQGLEELGHHPRAVPDGEQLMALCERGDGAPDLFLLDFSLPDYNGRELVEWLRDRGIEAPIVLTSGLMPNTPDIHAALQARKVLFLQKPFTLRELGDLIDMALGDTLLD